MRKAVSILLLCSTLFALSACGTGGVEESAGGGLKDTQEALSEESAQEISENIAKTESYTGSGILRRPSLIQRKYWSRLALIEQTLLRQKRQLTSGWIISALPLQKPIQKV